MRKACALQDYAWPSPWEKPSQGKPLKVIDEDHGAIGFLLGHLPKAKTAGVLQDEARSELREHRGGRI
jgi:hypothetical protein